MKYRKKPVIVEAVQWTGQNEAEIREFAAAHAGPSRHRVIVKNGALNVYVAKSEALCVVRRGGAVIAEPDGEGIYPCTPEQFDATYEPADDAKT